MQTVTLSVLYPSLIKKIYTKSDKKGPFLSKKLNKLNLGGAKFEVGPKILGGGY